MPVQSIDNAVKFALCLDRDKTCQNIGDKTVSSPAYAGRGGHAHS